MLRESGVFVPIAKAKCVIIRAALIDEHLLTYDLDYLGKKYVGVGKDDTMLDELRKVFGAKKSRNELMSRLSEAPFDIVAKYAKQDTNTTLKLGLWQEPELDGQNLRGVDDLEHRLLPVLIDMERGGVRVDVGRAERAVEEITVIVDRTRCELDSEAGFPINPNPSGSIHKLFNPVQMPDGRWKLVDGTVAESTDAGKASIDADCLRRMMHPLAEKILRVRKLMKARDTFLLGHILGHQHQGYVHCNFNQTKSDNDAGCPSTIGTRPPCDRT